jgi:pilus assembly protein CpaE
MADRIKALVALDTGMTAEAVGRALPQDGHIELVGVVDGVDEALTALQETPADLLVVACAGHSERALFLIDGAVQQRPSRPVVVLTLGSPNGFLRRVFEAGADDVIVLPQTPDDVRFVLEKAMARRHRTGGETATSQAPLVCILGPKGGTGKTLTAVNLAVALAERGERVGLIDLDLQFGDVGLCLGLVPDSTIYDLVKAGGSLDEDKLDGFLTTHLSGVKVLLAPSRPDHASAVTVEFLREVYTVFRRMVDYVIVDTPPGFTPEVITTIDSATSVCMVGMLDSLSLKNTKLGLETLDLMGFPAERTRLVLNRSNSRVGITNDDVAAIIGRQPDVLVPSDREIPRAINEGTPMVTARAQSEASAAFRLLADKVTQPDDEEQPKSGRRRLLLGRRRS